MKGCYSNDIPVFKVMNKMYTTNSLWNYFAEFIFNAKMIKSPALNSTQCTFPDISNLKFPRICQGWGMQGRWLGGRVHAAASALLEGKQQKPYTGFCLGGDHA